MPELKGWRLLLRRAWPRCGTVLRRWWRRRARPAGGGEVVPSPFGPRTTPGDPLPISRDEREAFESETHERREVLLDRILHRLHDASGGFVRLTARPSRAGDRDRVKEHATERSGR